MASDEQVKRVLGAHLFLLSKIPGDPVKIALKKKEVLRRDPRDLRWRGGIGELKPRERWNEKTENEIRKFEKEFGGELSEQERCELRGLIQRTFFG